MKTYKHWAAPLVWAALVFIAYSLPAQHLTYEEPWDLFRWDKAVHFSLFFIQMWLVLKSASPQKRKAAFFLLCVVISYGAILEGFQSSWFEGRATEWNDFVANTFGATGAFLWFFFRSLKATLKHDPEENQ